MTHLLLNWISRYSTANTDRWIYSLGSWRSLDFTLFQSTGPSSLVDVSLRVSMEDGYQLRNEERLYFFFTNTVIMKSYCQDNSHLLTEISTYTIEWLQINESVKQFIYPETKLNSHWCIVYNEWWILFLTSLCNFYCYGITSWEIRATEVRLIYKILRKVEHG